VLALKLANAERDLNEAGERLKEAEAQVADLTRLVGLATTAQAEAATALPPLRNDEAAAAAALQRLRVAHDALTAEAERVAEAQQEAGTRLAQTETDIEREQGRKSDAAAAIADGTVRDALSRQRQIEELPGLPAQQARSRLQAAGLWEHGGHPEQALETLAVIAYKQPITALEVTEIRGVNTAGVLSTLLERPLIKIVGRKAVVGRPFLYATTKEFLIRFGLNDLSDLPKVEDMAEALGLEAPVLVEQVPPEEMLPLEEE